MSTKVVCDHTDHPVCEIEIITPRQIHRLETTVRDVEAPPLTTEVPAEPLPPSQPNGGTHVGFPTSRRVEFSPTR